ncbi:bifunctional UDP-N-acetylglucosamine diphosphorylase/glucosamine-1-phosphate N-acetyltransferase GlmU [Gammaproteobacteria bacterium]|nr:bifunctional UDP-N-acetylglucosamine diphosphorylase/glucosamine-1-phosphate N-acetyltransferase GlmU [Gammaproteobacteria bacterium]
MVSVHAIILAAGKGTRMRSEKPKVALPLAGEGMIRHVMRVACALSDHQTVVIGHGREAVEGLLDDSVSTVVQAEQLGTGHAVSCGMKEVDDQSIVLVMYGDMPLIRTDDLQPLIDAACAGRYALLTAELEQPTRFGRIVRDDHGSIQRIVEFKDCDAAQREIREVNTGFSAAPASLLRRYLPQLSNQNAQSEYYLTDLVELALTDGAAVEAIVTGNQQTTLGANDRVELAELDRLFQQRRIQELMLEGLGVHDPRRLQVRGELQHGSDCELACDVLIEGVVKLGNRVRVEQGAILRDCAIGDDSVVNAYSVVESATLGASVAVGPFARLRPGTVLADQVRIGNFVETKNAQFGLGSKAGHLSYVGDAAIGCEVNIGAGTITCNYDGANKHRTEIGNRVFVGSNTALVAPISIGDDATIGAGSTLTKSLDSGVLAVSRARATVFRDWQRPVKSPKTTKD